ncbi:hypothetical protein [Rhodococcus erythropolis]|uniref:Uncharacterized protein n=1 Tax=Rhodococcus erythropolis TaxID=1833 RepID=A0A8I1A1R0_RHOER|nr:hypothetical protein [Rhodococcus erythropolis]MBH5146503.1 hypothetical protein [Rhodococcus erythropolis]
MKLRSPLEANIARIEHVNHDRIFTVLSAFPEGIQGDICSCMFSRGTQHPNFDNDDTDHLLSRSIQRPSDQTSLTEADDVLFATDSSPRRWTAQSKAQINVISNNLQILPVISPNLFVDYLTCLERSVEFLPWVPSPRD